MELQVFRCASKRTDERVRAAGGLAPAGPGRDLFSFTLLTSCSNCSLWAVSELNEANDEAGFIWSLFHLVFDFACVVVASALHSVYSAAGEIVD